MTFTRLQISFLFIIYMTISNHVIVLPQLLKIARRDAWISVLIAYAFLIIWGLLLHIALRRIGKEKLYDWLKGRVGKRLAHCVIALFLLMLLGTAVISLNDFILTVNIYFLPQTPFFIVSSTFVVLCLYAARSEAAGLRNVTIQSLQGQVALKRRRPLCVVYGIK